MMTAQMMMIPTLYYNNMFNDNDVQLYMMTAIIYVLITYHVNFTLFSFHFPYL